MGIFPSVSARRAQNPRIFVGFLLSERAKLASASLCNKKTCGEAPECKRDILQPSKVMLFKFYEKMKEQAVKWFSEEKWSRELISLSVNRTVKCSINAEYIFQWIWNFKKVILLKIIPTKRSENSRSILDAAGNEDLESIV